MESSVMNSATLEPPPPCEKCGYLTGILNKTPSHNIPSSSFAPTRPPEAEISKFQLAITQLQSRLSNIRKFQKFQHSLLSPIRRLPDELLAEIFGYICSRRINVGRDHDPIWGLQQVCKRWQTVVTSIPLLWNAFEVNVRRNYDYGTIASRVQSCLKFSGKAPLSVYISDFPIDFPLKIFIDIVSHANRWVSFTAEGDLLDSIATCSQYGPIIKDLIESRGLAQLRELTLMFSVTNRCPFYLFRSAIALEQVYFGVLNVLPDVSDSFPWTNVKGLKIQSCDLTSEDRIISAFSALSSLEVLIWKGNYTMLGSLPQTVVTLPALRSLTIQDPDDLEFPMDSIWPMFRIPSLMKIRLIDDILNIEPLFSMIRLSGSALFLTVVKELYNIEELSLIDLHESLDVLTMLVWEPASVAEPVRLLPSLRRLEFRRSAHDVDCEDSVTPAVDNQQESAPLYSLVTLKWTIGNSAEARSVYGSESLAQLKSLGEELGIKVEVEFDLG
ncbi:hypothetical protein BDQ17DRAFT_1359894 [Cyathus striatus]|nr:hypothetical protein BDQ17DRAFT_1359894 [Cyathus striatus]